MGGKNIKKESQLSWPKQLSVSGASKDLKLKNNELQSAINSWKLKLIRLKSETLIKYRFI